MAGTADWKARAAVKWALTDCKMAKSELGLCSVEWPWLC